LEYLLLNFQKISTRTYNPNLRLVGSYLFESDKHRPAMELATLPSSVGVEREKEMGGKLERQGRQENEKWDRW